MRSKSIGSLIGKFFIIAIVLLVLLQLYFFVQICWWRYVNPSSTSFMRIQLAQLREKHPDAELQFKWVDYQAISPAMKRAAIASEDATFMTHHGVNWDAIQGAFEKNKMKGRVVAGGSTITQQLAKNLFLSGERSYIRKAQEIVIAYMLEAVLGKKRILEIYLNVAEWGTGVFGIEMASRHYYGISAKSLNNWQAARLAAMLPKPRYYEVHLGANSLESKASRVVRWIPSIEIPK